MQRRGLTRTTTWVHMECERGDIIIRLYFDTHPVTTLAVCDTVILYDDCAHFINGDRGPIIIYCELDHFRQMILNALRGSNVQYTRRAGAYQSSSSAAASSSSAAASGSSAAASGSGRPTKRRKVSGTYTCCVCLDEFDRNRGVVNASCPHGNVCPECSDCIDRCPMCRKDWDPVSIHERGKKEINYGLCALRKLRL